MRLVACRQCRAQYDVTFVTTAEIACACGAPVSALIPAAVDAEMHRCASCGAALTDATAPSCDFCRSPVVRDRRRLSLLCPECWARNPDDAAFCTHRGVRFEPQPLPVAPNDGHACPVCAAPMARRQVFGVAVEECGLCQGLWVGGPIFDGLLHRAAATPDPKPSDGLDPMVPRQRTEDARTGYRRCPECQGHMPRKNFGKTSGVLVDWCGRHGTWLDRDELGRIATFVRAGGLIERTPPPDDGTALIRRIEAARSRADATAARRDGGSIIETLISVFSGGSSWD